MSILTAHSTDSNIVEFKQPEPRGFFKLRHALLSSTNWQSLTTDEIALFIEIAGKYRPGNNGEILFSIEDAKQRFHIGYDKAARSFDAIEEHNLAVRRQHGTFDFQTKPEMYTKWELTPFVLGSYPEPNPQVGSYPEPNTPTLGPAAEPNRSIERVDNKERTNFGIQEEGRTESLPTQDLDNPSSSSPSPSMNGVPRAANGGGARGYYVCSGTSKMLALEEWERARGKSFPRDKRGGWELSAPEYAAFTAWCSGEAAL